MVQLQWGTARGMTDERRWTCEAAPCRETTFWPALCKKCLGAYCYTHRALHTCVPVDDLWAEAAQEELQPDWPAAAGLPQRSKLQVAWLMGDDEDGPNGPLTWAWLPAELGERQGELDKGGRHLYTLHYQEAEGCAAEDRLVSFVNDRILMDATDGALQRFQLGRAAADAAAGGHQR